MRQRCSPASSDGIGLAPTRPSLPVMRCSGPRCAARVRTEAVARSSSQARGEGCLPPGPQGRACCRRPRGRSAFARPKHAVLRSASPRGRPRRSVRRELQHLTRPADAELEAVRRALANQGPLPDAATVRRARAPRRGAAGALPAALGAALTSQRTARLVGANVLRCSACLLTSSAGARAGSCHRLCPAGLPCSAPRRGLCDQQTKAAQLWRCTSPWTWRRL